MIKSVLGRYLPSALFYLRAWRQRDNFYRTLFRRQEHHKTILFNGSEPRILSGPFAGLKYLDEIVWGPIEPRWLGTYECELTPIINQIVQTPYSIIIDVGSAEGYYSIGLAKQLPDATVYSYDVDPWARQQQKRLAHLNDVANVQIKAVCTASELASRISGRSLLICDIEGFEYQLLDPNKTSALKRCDILVELHEFEQAGLTMETGTKELMRRFSDSHEISLISARRREVTDFRAASIERLSNRDIADCMNEMRSLDQRWMWLEVRKE